jgi:cathepsin L
MQQSDLTTMTNHDLRCDGTKRILNAIVGNEPIDGTDILTFPKHVNSFAGARKYPSLWIWSGLVSTITLLLVLGNLQHDINPHPSGPYRLLVRSRKQPKEIQRTAASITGAISSVNDSKNIVGSITEETKEAKMVHIKTMNQKMETTFFADFESEHGKTYANPEEYNRRQGIFYDNLSTILRHNANAETENSQSSWKMGINSFADRSSDELPKGLDKYALRSYRKRTTNPAFAEATQRRDSKRPYSLSSLPDSVDWRDKGVTTPVKNQGHCGSCWAFASTAALESHIAIQTGKLLELSVQELVTCAPNPNHCGGTGGCDGNTAELAYEFISSGRGILTEWQWAYTSGKNHSVPACDLPTDHNSTIQGAIASIEGYSTLEPNDYVGLLHAVATIGPVVVNVATTGWHLYESGIFDDSQFISSDRDIDHVVVVEGYGTEVNTDATTGEEHRHDYWLVRNSWGPLWGEDGYIRLKRDSEATKNDCQPDVTPADGIGCVGPDDTILPPVVEVCGASGILYDGVYPTGVHLLKG